MEKDQVHPKAKFRDVLLRILRFVFVEDKIQLIQLFRLASSPIMPSQWIFIKITLFFIYLT